MKAVILAGGFGTRLAEETGLRPKPMVEIGGKPILWHIMKTYSHHGINDFVICLGYKGYFIKEYFQNYFLHNADVTFDIKQNSMTVHEMRAEPWTVTLVETGENSQIGGRIKRASRYFKDDEAVCITYGDGVADVNITAAIEFHKQHGKLATVTAVQPPGRFGALDLQDEKVLGFQEKPVGDGGWINGGYFIVSPKIVDYIDDDFTVWEREPLENLANDDQLRAWYHHGFWQPMDTLRDKEHLNRLWSNNEAKWKVW
ncbi:glucose-1-phosphate cytidylyltransferase [Ruegeria lacuscaerulensis]|uniref:glucose-1-phosphate cytidylyltransferase n=1 Tax=Ruegeria lacuscaerulensis TaxID=55218 RepID=UPI00147AF8C6|nr:glucose-1-phosphate cytidylyltransferase [Ruegeria lacuscaerulensis]